MCKDFRKFVLNYIIIDKGEFHLELLLVAPKPQICGKTKIGVANYYWVTLGKNVDYAINKRNVCVNFIESRTKL